MINSKIRAKDRIHMELPEELKNLMRQYVLTEEKHQRILEDIKQQSYAGKSVAEKPKYIVVVGQTGSGKSNLTSSIYAKDNNLVIIDSDKYKSYREDNQEILREHLAEYAFLTAPDAYLHRDEMIEDAMRSKYNILMECATSKKDGLFISIPKIQNAGYSVELHILGVSSLNSAISIHERYEELIKLKNNTAKLTGLSRHDDSFQSLLSTIRKEQNKKNVKINVYKRGKKYPFEPELLYSSSEKARRFSSPVEAMLYAQAHDFRESLITAKSRIDTIKKQMDDRLAPEVQKEQLREIEKRYELIIERGREG